MTRFPAVTTQTAQAGGSNTITLSVVIYIGSYIGQVITTTGGTGSGHEAKAIYQLRWLYKRLRR